MGVSGVRKASGARVSLNEFFENETFVDIKIISPYARAQIREVLMDGFNIGDVDAKGKATSVQAKTAGMADREMRIRDLKLINGFAGTNMKNDDGTNVAWNAELWKELDDADPRILEKVVNTIDEVSRLTPGGESQDPT